MSKNNTKISKQSIGLDLTKSKLKKFNEFIIQEPISDNLKESGELSGKIGLDLTNNSHNKIDLTKYGEGIE
jgi:hypothetical protein